MPVGLEHTNPTSQERRGTGLQTCAGPQTGQPGRRDSTSQTGQPGLRDSTFQAGQPGHCDSTFHRS